MSSPVFKLVAIAALLVAGMIGGCSRIDHDRRRVADEIRKSLDQSGYKDVSVSQDPREGCVGVSQATSLRMLISNKRKTIAKSMAAGQVVADEIQVLPAGAES